MVNGLLPESRDAFKIRVRMIEAPKLVDKTLFLFFDFMLTIFEAAGSNFSKLQKEKFHNTDVYGLRFS